MPNFGTFLNIACLFLALMSTYAILPKAVPNFLSYSGCLWAFAIICLWFILFRVLISKVAK